MTPVQAIAVLIIRLWAVGAAVGWMMAFAQALGLAIDGNEIYQGTLFGYLQLASYALVLAFWTVILCYSKTVTAWALPAVEEADHKIRIDPEDLIRIGTFLIGVFYLTEYVPDFLRSAPVFISQYIETPRAWGGRIPDGLLQLGATMIAILIALWLMIRPGQLVRLFSWLRSAGQPKPQPVDEA